MSSDWTERLGMIAANPNSATPEDVRKLVDEHGRTLTAVVRIGELQREINSELEKLLRDLSQTTETSIDEN